LLTFSVSQHIRDLLLLKQIKNYLGCGIIEQISTRPNFAVFVVYKFNDTFDKILPFFESNLLLGSKRLDYLDFQSVANMMKEKAHLTEKGINKIFQIKSGMNTGRK